MSKAYASPFPGDSTSKLKSPTALLRCCHPQEKENSKTMDKQANENHFLLTRRKNRENLITIQRPLLMEKVMRLTIILNFKEKEMKRSWAR